jgi:oligosaccharide 4-alpha-D-glucosyltransferase
MGNLDWVNKKAWLNPVKMIGDFKKDNINTILITEPFVLKSSLNYEASKQFHAVDVNGKPYVLTDFYFGQGGIIDIFRKDAQQWFWSKHITQMNKGVEGWWGDLGEPEKHPADVLHNLKDLGFKRLFKADEVHNLYGHTWAKMLFNSYAKDYPTKRLFSLNRSGFAGTQRYSIFPWTGDVSRSWSGLKAQLPILLGMSMSGVPYVHSDAGGFAGGEGDNELYIRWLQMAAFTPIFRPHGTALYEVDKNAFSFPSEAALIDTPYKLIAKKIIDLRYKLLPYNYTLAYEQTKFGKPLIAPLHYHFPKDTTAINISDEFMWGENILVAPILNKGATTRDVYLPVGSEKYYKFNSSRQYNNGHINDTANLNQQLVYVPEGKIIPIWQHTNGGNTSKYDKAIIEWQYYLTQKNNVAEFVLYDDDGISKQPNGKLLKIKVEEKDNTIHFMGISEFISKNSTGFKKEMLFKIYGVHKLPKSIFLNKDSIDRKDWNYEERNHTITIDFVLKAEQQY